MTTSIRAISPLRIGSKYTVEVMRRTSVRVKGCVIKVGNNVFDGLDSTIPLLLLAHLFTLRVLKLGL